MKKIAVINDLSGFGKCSLTVALPIISAHGIQCCPLATGVFSNQTGYDSYKSVDLTDYMQDFIDQWKRLSPHFDGILTGFIPNSAQGEIIAKFIDDFKTDNTVVVVDPVIGDDGEIYPCYDDNSIKAVKKLVSKADIITPNLTELCVLTGNYYDDITSSDIDDVLEKIKEMSALAGKTVVTTGIHISDKEIANAVYSNDKLTVIKAKKLGNSFSGTGDILSSFITSRYLCGESIENAVKKASRFIEKSVALTVEETGSNYNPCDGIYFEKFLKDI